MIQFQSISVQTFLTDFWQKKPLLIRQALPHFINPLTPEELAGLALEDDVESRLVLEKPNQTPAWELKQGPFVEKDFTTLAKTHWTLLVQGVDRLIPEVADLLNHFDFLPQWRVDDVMISYAVNQGSVGPHYDHYDVFLFQASGRRKWLLTTQDCYPENYLNEVPLRIMSKFTIEEEYILEPGDMLYLPPHVAHHGISLDDDCMTYSFGYRSYQSQEMWDSLGDHLSEQETKSLYYRDPSWANLDETSSIPKDAWLNAKALMQQILDDDKQIKTWFGCFATRIDMSAQQQMPEPLEDDERGELLDFIHHLKNSTGLQRDATCRLAYYDDTLQLFINGCVWDTENVDVQLVKLVANQRSIDIKELSSFLHKESNADFLYNLWILQWLVMV